MVLPSLRGVGAMLGPASFRRLTTALYVYIWILLYKVWFTASAAGASSCKHFISILLVTTGPTPDRAMTKPNSQHTTCDQIS